MRLLIYGQRHPEPAALAGPAADAERASVAQGHVARHGQPEAGAGPGRLGGEQRVEDPSQELLGNAGPGVRHLAHRNAPSVWAETRSSPPSGMASMALVNRL